MFRNTETAELKLSYVNLPMKRIAPLLSSVIGQARSSAFVSHAQIKNVQVFGNSVHKKLVEKNVTPRKQSTF